MPLTEVVPFSVHVVLSFALKLQQAVDECNAAAKAAATDAASDPSARAAGGEPAAKAGRPWQLLVGVAQGPVVAGGLEPGRPGCCFFGGAAEEALRLVREGRPGEIRVQRRLARSSAAASAFAFAAPAAAQPDWHGGGGEAAGSGLVLVGRSAGGTQGGGSRGSGGGGFVAAERSPKQRPAVRQRGPPVITSR